MFLWPLKENNYEKRNRIKKSFGKSPQLLSNGYSNDCLFNDKNIKGKKIHVYKNESFVTKDA